ncbi:hypothetical protein HK099_003093 [Clydaea vesicula]|uniref:WD40 repeat domain-containing protein n=1 Tax=Clydaea vesicula TaxID=447962 RepID=A0AAD5XWH8_9FUNG|nr:hypothetical protein HK099_003093 [Clydaea vesicula]
MKLTRFIQLMLIILVFTVLTLTLKAGIYLKGYILDLIDVRFFATGGIEAIAGLWEFEDLSCIKTFGDVEDEIRGLSFSHDGDLLAIGTSKGTRDRESSLSIAIETGETVFKVKSPNGISSLAFHPSRLLLAVARDKHDCPEIKAELKGYEICKVCKGMNPRDYEKKEPTVKLYGMVS